MPDLTTPLPVRRTELLIRPLGDAGQYVVKDPATGAYFHLGEEEHFLLQELDGAKDAEAIRGAFEQRFGQSLSGEELDEFVEMARGQGFLQTASVGQAFQPDVAPKGQTGKPDLQAEAPGSPNRQSILHWRKNFFDPDRFFTWLEPRIRFFWTRAFLLFSAGCIVFAIGVAWANAPQLASSFAHALRWETAFWAWLVLFVVTMLHEFAHGLTCKHHGGEVHEVGFLMLFFMPCFYCNVSDAWLFKEKSKRLWVTFAGGYFELFLWAWAVFVWRLTVPESMASYLAFIVIAACGLQTLFNFLPLLKLDGYYLLSDWQEIPNLQQRALDRFKGRLRWLLWGAAKPERAPRGGFLFGFGLATWLYSLIFLALMLWAFCQFLWPSWGWLGVGVVLLLGWVSGRALFKDLASGEVKNMIRLRPKRTIIWLATLTAIAAVLYFVDIEDRAGAPFQIRSLTRVELRAPFAGFVKACYFDDGDRVSPGAAVVEIEVPDLASRLAQKRAEVKEAQAKLRLLEIGPRPEEVAEQRRRVARAKTWRNLAEKDLGHFQEALKAELGRLDEQIVQSRAELATAQAAHVRAFNLRTRKSISEEEYQEAERRLRVARSQLAQADFQKRHRQALGTREALAGLDAEAELARREKELAEAQATFALLELGSRPEEVAAEQARLARLQEEARYLQTLQGKVLVHTTATGVVTTPRLKEKVGQYVKEGELICVVEEPAAVEAEIALSEQDAARVQIGQAVALKARALPFDGIAARVDRRAAAAGRGDTHTTVTVYCRLEDPPAALLPGMTGHARIYTGRRSLGAIGLDRVLRLVRTEFWW